jgi:putative membrane protein
MKGHRSILHRPALQKGKPMQIAAYALAGLVLLIHIYIVLIETVLFRTSGVRVFRIAPGEVERLAPIMSNQGCYNLFLVAALTLGLFHPLTDVASAFLIYGLACVVVAGLWGGLTVSRRILYVQALPAAVALAAYILS